MANLLSNQVYPGTKKKGSRGLAPLQGRSEEGQERPGATKKLRRPPSFSYYHAI
ncbi:hypothetical protein MBAV_004639 [Candidatus Magnetobacterium bavaricum]|uniref:Uncharacterized protein n=1 Tax=Candidatus Magnetobacterium bavaricum TaxID=29290 RepID=A0A0F3GR36_9BACT|nr:hypothetical protein MBAV_004639 [Candidatus Magnetobacterium bavaricum]